MPNNTNRKGFWTVVVIFVLAAMACNIPSQRNAAPPTVVPLSPQEAQQFEQNLQETLTNADGGEVTVTITEGQLSAYLASQLANQNDDTISKPRVRLTNGRMEIYAQVKQGITLDAKSVVVPSVDSSGRPHLLVESVSLGSIAVPENFVNQMQQMVDRLLEEYLASSSDRFTVTKIEITEGQLVVSGIPE